MRGSRIVIPTALRLEMLDKIHTGHQGITKCRERARHSIWWPGLSKQLEELVKACPQCCRAQNQRAEPLIPSSLPELPWQRVGTDLFEWRKHTYVLIVTIFPGLSRSPVSTAPQLKKSYCTRKAYLRDTGYQKSLSVTTDRSMIQKPMPTSHVSSN